MENVSTKLGSANSYGVNKVRLPANGAVDRALTKITFALTLLVAGAFAGSEYKKYLDLNAKSASASSADSGSKMPEEASEQMLGMEAAITSLVQAIESGDEDLIINAQREMESVISIHNTDVKEIAQIRDMIRACKLLIASRQLSLDISNPELIAEYRDAHDACISPNFDSAQDLRLALQSHVSGDLDAALDLYEEITKEERDTPFLLATVARAQKNSRQLLEIESSEINEESISMSN
jgi:hypothetical protein